MDFAIVLRLHDRQNLGWSRMAEEYRKLSGEYISRDTIKRRYYDAKHKMNDSDKFRQAERPSQKDRSSEH